MGLHKEQISAFVSPAAAKSLQSCPTLCDPWDGSPPGSPVPGILQARTLEWVAISFSNAWKWKVKVKWLSRVWLLATPRISAHRVPPSIGFSRQECWSGVPLPPPFVSPTPSPNRDFTHRSLDLIATCFSNLNENPREVNWFFTLCNETALSLECKYQI